MYHRRELRIEMNLCTSRRVRERERERERRWGAEKERRIIQSEATGIYQFLHFLFIRL
jgi:hypothetical protein